MPSLSETKPFDHIDIQPRPPRRQRASRTRRKLLISFLSLLLAIALVGAAVFIYFRVRAKPTDEVTSLIAEVSKVALLPSGQTPIVYTVVDATQLMATQPFFNGAVNGDKLLLYPTAEKAILFSPSRDLIVNAGPIISSQQPATVTATASTSTTTSPESSAHAGTSTPSARSSHST